MIRDARYVEQFLGDGHSFTRYGRLNPCRQLSAIADIPPRIKRRSIMPDLYDTRVPVVLVGKRRQQSNQARP